jgi:2-polyprenyl-6-hydroxyphenyl methylase/3-demethylubiquinone-9 3-methyltransferase
MAQRTKKLARNHKSAFPEKPIVPAMAQSAGQARGRGASEAAPGEIVLVGLSEYEYKRALLNGSHQYLLPAVLKILKRTSSKIGEKSVFDLGCGSGAFADEIHKAGYRVAGVDPSTTGAALAKQHFPHLDLRQGSSHDNLRGQFGTFSYVISLEVICLVNDPRSFARSVRDLLKPDGYALISTPYHGYLKNLAIALTNGFDNHVKPLWDNGYAKFWSQRTLTQLLTETGFKSIRFVRVGRIPPLAASMIAIAKLT